jgi:transcriptional regulator with XRE-family HTH domain
MARRVGEFYEALGRRIQQHRKKRRLTQEELGARLDPRVTRASIANIESGKQRVLAHSLAQIAEAFEVTTDELIGGRSVRIQKGLNQQVAAQLQDGLRGKAISPEDLQRLSRKLGLEDGDDGR